MDFDGYNLVTASAVFAAEAHMHQVRKELNEPYINHPLRVGMLAAKLGQSPEFIAAAHLHDVVEDTNIQIEAIASLFPERTTDLVRAMTKFWQTGVMTSAAVDVSKQAYYDNLIALPGGALLKVLDRIDNLHDFAKMARRAMPKSHKWGAKYLDKTRREFVPVIAFLRTDVHGSAQQALTLFESAQKTLEDAL